MNWLNILWQAAIIIVPAVFTWIKGSEVKDNRWSQVLLPVAETVWNAVEAWKSTLPMNMKAAPAVSKQEFMSRVKQVLPKLTNGELGQLSAWADQRSLAAKNGLLSAVGTPLTITEKMSLGLPLPPPNVPKKP